MPIGEAQWRGRVVIGCPCGPVHWRCVGPLWEGGFLGSTGYESFFVL